MRPSHWRQRPDPAPDFHRAAGGTLRRQNREHRKRRRPAAAKPDRRVELRDEQGISSDSTSGKRKSTGVSRRGMLFGSAGMISTAAGLQACWPVRRQRRKPHPGPHRRPMASGRTFWSSGATISAGRTFGLRHGHTMGYRTPNIDRIGHEGIIFTDHYAQPPARRAGRPSSPGNIRSARG